MKEHRRRAVAIISKGDEVLLIHRINPGRPEGDQEYYVLPGGGIEEGETDLQAVEREVAEETSLEVEIGQALYRLTDPNPDATNAEEVYYLCNYVSGEPKMSDGIPEVQKMKAGNQQYNLGWYTREDITAINLYPVEIRELLIKDMQTGFKQTEEKRVDRKIR